MLPTARVSFWVEGNDTVLTGYSVSVSLSCMCTSVSKLPPSSSGLSGWAAESGSPPASGLMSFSVVSWVLGNTETESESRMMSSWGDPELSVTRVCRSCCETTLGSTWLPSGRFGFPRTSCGKTSRTCSSLKPWSWRRCSCRIWSSWPIVPSSSRISLFLSVLSLHSFL